MPKQIEVTDATAAWVETSAFMNSHPEFFACPQNGKKLAEYCEKKKWDITIDNLEKALEALKDRRELIVPNARTFAKMTAEEVKLLAAANGEPIYEGDRIIGYRMDHRWQGAPAVRTQHKRPKSQMQHPEDFNYVPTKREFALWDSTRIKEWAEANGHDGHELPALR